MRQLNPLLSSAAGTMVSRRDDVSGVMMSGLMVSGVTMMTA